MIKVYLENDWNIFFYLIINYALEITYVFLYFTIIKGKYKENLLKAKENIKKHCYIQKNKNCS